MYEFCNFYLVAKEHIRVTYVGKRTKLNSVSLVRLCQQTKITLPAKNNNLKNLFSGGKVTVSSSICMIIPWTTNTLQNEGSCCDNFSIFLTKVRLFIFTSFFYNCSSLIFKQTIYVYFRCYVQALYSTSECIWFCLLVRILQLNA